MKNLWMPMYWPNYLADTAHFTTLEHGAYLLLIAYYWCNGGLPDDDKQLIRIARVRFQDWKRMRPVLSSKFEPGWRHKRIDLELAKALKLQEAGKKSDNVYRSKRRRNVNVVPPHTNTNTYKDLKSQNDKTAGTGSGGYVASPQTEEFKKWKAWAYAQPSRALWRELQQREQEGRPFNFESQWPPTDTQSGRPDIQSVPTDRALSGRPDTAVSTGTVTEPSQRKSGDENLKEQIWISQKSKEWKAWEVYYLKTKGVRPPATTSKNDYGWWFASVLPPTAR